jgi:hypothetical protein
MPLSDLAWLSPTQFPSRNARNAVDGDDCIAHFALH